jgi:Flp pilus assembly protein protease CpaA
MDPLRLLVVGLLILAGMEDLRTRRVPLAWAAAAVGAAVGGREDPVRVGMALLSILSALLGAGRIGPILRLPLLLHPTGVLLWPASAAAARGRMGMGDLAALAAIGAAFPWPALALAGLALLFYERLARLRRCPDRLPAMPAIAFGAALAVQPGLAPLSLLLALSAVRFGVIPEEGPEGPIGRFGDLPFWPGSLTLLAGPPGALKTSWALRMAAEASVRMPSAFACFEHTPEELAFRLRRMAGALKEDPARWARLILLAPLDDRQDTVRALEERLLEEGFPPKGPAFLAVDYLQRLPVYGLEGPVPEARRGGEAAAALRALARRRGWTVLAISAVRADAFRGEPDLAALLGDERIAYEADRVIWIAGSRAVVLKDRHEALREFHLDMEPDRFAVWTEWVSWLPRRS